MVIQEKKISTVQTEKPINTKINTVQINNNGYIGKKKIISTIQTEKPINIKTITVQINNNGYIGGKKKRKKECIVQTENQ